MARSYRRISTAYLTIAQQHVRNNHQSGTRVACLPISTACCMSPTSLSTYTWQMPSEWPNTGIPWLSSWIRRTSSLEPRGMTRSILSSSFSSSLTSSRVLSYSLQRWRQQIHTQMNLSVHKDTYLWTIFDNKNLEHNTKKRFCNVVGAHNLASKWCF